MNRNAAELSRRTTFLGVLAWVSVCLTTIALFPDAAEQLQTLWLMTGMTGLLSTVGLLQVVRREESQLQKLLLRALRASRTDPLTGLANRRELDARLEELMIDSRRSESPLCVLMIDADCFKNLNDTYGHATGDRVLQSIAATLTKTVRMDDLVCRYGGEEFLVVTPGVTLTAARSLSERIRIAVQKHEASPELAGIAVTVSIGVAMMECDDSPQILIDRADRALYCAKSAGRNCTFCCVDGSCMSVSDAQIAASFTESPLETLTAGCGRPAQPELPLTESACPSL